MSLERVVPPELITNVAGSIALVGFGFDSLIEVFAATIVVWELRRVGEGAKAARAPAKDGNS